MKLAVFSAKPYDKKYLGAVHASRGTSCDAVELTFHDFSLGPSTVSLVQDVDAVCVFVNDTVNGKVLTALNKAGVRAVLLRCAGYNNVDLPAAEKLGFFVANVPSYSPEAVAEFAAALMQTLNRKTHRAFNRVREGNFNLDGLLGRTMHGKTAGVVGTGKIGVCMARILHGFGCKVLAYDLYPNDALLEYGEYTSLDELLTGSDVISLHCPLFETTRHMINEQTLARMKAGAMLVNTSRGGLIDTKAAIESLKNKHLGGLALDVYEAESGLFYQDHSQDIIEDDDLMRLMTFPNVLVCGHQAFFTEEALMEIAECTFSNLDAFANKLHCKNSLVREGYLLVRKDSHPVRI